MFSTSDSSATPIPTKYRPHIAPIAIFWLGVRAVGPPSTQHLIQVPNFMAADMKMGIWRGFWPSQHFKCYFNYDTTSVYVATPTKNITYRATIVPFLNTVVSII